MIVLLSKLFIHNRERIDDPAVRRAWGALCGAVGILLNLLLFCAKALAGVFTGSIAVTADAFNNLSDALTSLITLAGFRLSARKPDRDHPFGHRRYEYIAGLVVSLAILLMGFNLARSSVERILNPAEIAFRPLSACILAASILVKLYMALYNRSIGRRICSATLAAASADSLSDMAATAAVLAAILLSHFAGINIDAWAGAAVSLLILLTGLRSARETISPLLGKAPDAEFVHRVEAVVAECPEILGMHDLMVHDYGAGRTVISLHAEVRADRDILSLHESIDRVERRLRDELRCSATIHMDPIAPGNGEADLLRERIELRMREALGEDASLHDFRYAPGERLCFDAVVPYECPLNEEDARQAIAALARELCPDCPAEITIDRPVCAND